MIYYKVYGFNLEDMLGATPYEENPQALNDLLTSAGIHYTLTNPEKALWVKVFNKYSTCIVFEDDTETPSSAKFNSELYRFFVAFVNKLIDTKDYYETLVNIYDDKLSHLMAQVEADTTNEVIFNDTPQTTSGVLSGDTYATTYTKTKSVSNSDMKSPIERIKDIQDSLRNIWADWVQEFRHLFKED